MPQEDMNPGKDESEDMTFHSATLVTCKVKSGSGEVSINDETTPRKFGGASGEIREQAFTGVTKITIKGTSLQNKFRVNF